MELELKHVAPYLPYALKIQGVNDGNVYIDPLTGIIKKEDTVFVDTDKYRDYLFAIKPIFRPLPDLAKEIEHDGKKFIPIVQLGRLTSSNVNIQDTFQFERLYKALLRDIMITKKIGLIHVEALFEWHFDIFGLIEQGLATDINTLPVNE